MGCSSLMHDALQAGDITRSLFQESTDKELVVELQKTLFELGFKRELKWDNFQADGDYGPATAAAVAAFATKNGVQSDGSSVSNKLAKLMLQRHDFLPEMYILWSIHKSDLRTRKFISKGTRVSIRAIQVLLNTLGYGAQLNFAKFGADGLYGSGTKKAMIAYATDNGITSDGDLLNRPLVNLLLKDINVFYGRDWSDLAMQLMPGGSSPLILYSGSRFTGKPCTADKEFEPMLEKINKYAAEADVFVFVNSSFRTSTNVNGAIVKPAKFSNHLAGHAIDMNLIHGDKQFANSKVLAKYPAVPAPIKKFIKSIIDDPKLRWGGEFRAADPVHIDDHLNKNMTEWDKRFNVMQCAVQLGQHA